MNIEETVGNFIINQEILEHGVVNLKKRYEKMGFRMKRSITQPDITKDAENGYVRLVEIDAIKLYNIHESHISGGLYGYCRSKECL